MEVEITRHSDDGIETIGTLHILDENGASLFHCDTLELPYKDNETSISCIPKGIYTCSKVPPSRIPYQHISINEVPNRFGICIHKANYVSELRGCIAVGMGLENINKDEIIDLTLSKVAFDMMMEILPNEFRLTIK